MARFSLSGSARRRAAVDVGIRRAADAVTAALEARERIMVAIAGPPGAASRRCRKVCGPISRIAAIRSGSFP